MTQTEPSFDGSRLALVRNLRGLLKKELAAYISKTPAAIGQFENGVVCPDRATIANLALVLRVRPNFFAPRVTDGNFSTESCHFRSLRSSTARERRHLLARGALTRDLVSLLNHTVELPAVNIPEVTTTISSVRQAEAAAAAVRREFGLNDEPIPNVIALLESVGVVIVPINRGGRRVSAFSTWTGDRPFIFLNDHEENARSRTRFDNSHELGHLVMHADISPGDRELEAQADGFASAFLLPKRPFLDECPSRLYWDQLISMKKKWGASLAAIVRRGFDLGRFSEATYRRAYVELNRRGWRHAEPAESDLTEEHPALLARAIETAEEHGITIQDLGRQLGVSIQDVTAVIYGTALSGGSEGAAA